MLSTQSGAWTCLSHHCTLKESLDGDLLPVLWRHPLDDCGAHTVVPELLIPDLWPLKTKQLLCLSSGSGSFLPIISQFKGSSKCSPQMFLLFPLFGGRTTTILRGLTYPKILCASKKERKRENGDIAFRRSSLFAHFKYALKDSPSKTTKAASFRGCRPWTETQKMTSWNSSSWLICEPAVTRPNVFISFSCGSNSQDVKNNYVTLQFADLAQILLVEQNLWMYVFPCSVCKVTISIQNIVRSMLDLPKVKLYLHKRAFSSLKWSKPVTGETLLKVLGEWTGLRKASFGETSRMVWRWTEARGKQTTGQNGERSSGITFHGCNYSCMSGSVG